MCICCRYANSSQQAIAARAEQQGLLIEGFNGGRLAREQAKLPNAGKGLHNEQVNILNLPMPDFDVSGNLHEAHTILCWHPDTSYMYMPLLYKGCDHYFACRLANQFMADRGYSEACEGCAYRYVAFPLSTRRFCLDLLDK